MILPLLCLCLVGSVALADKEAFKEPKLDVQPKHQALFKLTWHLLVRESDIPNPLLQA